MLGGGGMVPRERMIDIAKLEASVSHVLKNIYIQMAADMIRTGSGNPRCLVMPSLCIYQLARFALHCVYILNILYSVYL